MKKKLLFILCGWSLFLIASSVRAEDLWTVYLQALSSDPALKQAEATMHANQEGVPQGAAALLPTLSGTAETTSYNLSKPRQLITSRNTLVNQSTFNTNGYTLTLTQPLFNFQNWMQLRSAGNVYKQANATYNAALQDLMMRTATAYFNVLQAEDTLTLTLAEKKAVADQLQQIRARFQVGMSTMTDVYQAQANYDSLMAQSIGAQNNVTNSFEALRQITNHTYTELSTLKTPFLLISPIPNNVEAWVKSSEQHNWLVMAAHYAELAAKENIRVNYAGHFPTVNAVGTYQRGNNNELGFGDPGTKQWESTAGLQLNVPIFQGGLVVSKTRQAQAQYLAADDQVEVQHRKAVLQAEESFNNVIASISKVEADRSAVTSAQSALDSTDAGYHAGTKTVLDVLTAEQNLYQAKVTLASDQYAYINNTLSLKQAAGTLSTQDILAVNRWLVPEKSSLTIPKPISLAYSHSDTKNKMKSHYYPKHHASLKHASHHLNSTQHSSHKSKTSSTLITES